MDEETIYIYGAGDTAKSIGYCLKDEPFHKHIEAFLVSDVSKEKDSSIFGIPVIEYTQAKHEYPVVIAVLEKYRDEVIANLISIGIDNYLSASFESNLGADIRKAKFFSLNREIGFNIRILNEVEVKNANKEKVRIYVAKSDVDKRINTSVSNKSWEIEIHAGRALANNKIAEISDNQGENISNKNRQYCEMTVLYWMWKNTQDKYLGLSHYRRRFALDSDDLCKITGSDIDVVLTVPIFNIPDVKHNYEKNHIKEDWEIFKKGVKTLFPDYMDSFEEMENGKFYFPYNMIITRKEIIDSYCEWAFQIFEYCEKNFTCKTIGYQMRDIGFLSERVMTLYFLHNRSKFKYAIADKVFYE